MLLPHPIYQNFLFLPNSQNRILRLSTDSSLLTVPKARLKLLEIEHFMQLLQEHRMACLRRFAEVQHCLVSNVFSRPIYFRLCDLYVASHSVSVLHCLTLPCVHVPGAGFFKCTLEHSPQMDIVLYNYVIIIIHPLLGRSPENC